MTSGQVRMDTAAGSRPPPTTKRGQRMRELRDKMEQMKEKRSGRANHVTQNVEVQEKKEPRTWRGTRLVRSRDVERNKVQSRDKKMLIVGSDVEALYPSLEDIEVAEIIYKAVLESSVEFDSIDYREAVKYISMNWSAQRCAMSDLRRVLPWRSKKSGVRPGVTGDGPMGADSGDCDQWTFPRICLTKLEKRKIVATVVQMGVIVLFNSHVYQFGGKFFLQKKGGPIGLRATCAIARVTMLSWDVKWQQIMKENGIEMEACGRYMDDLRAFLYGIRKGWRWWDGELCYCQEWEREDEAVGMCDLERTTTVLQEIMKEVCHFLRMTMETELDFQERTLPTLDVQLWVSEGNVVQYNFFEKPMASNQCIHKDTALAEDTKMATLNGEVVRRMQNTSEELPTEARVKVLDRFCQKMRNSGYRTQQMRTVLIGGLKCYEKRLAQSKLDRESKGWRALHESAMASQGARTKKKLLAKSTWFKNKQKEEDTEKVGNGGQQGQNRRDNGAGGKKGKNGRTEKREKEWRQQRERQTDGQKEAKKVDMEATSVFFVDQTKNGGLAKELRALEDRLALLTGFRVKVVEAGGTQLKQMLPSTNPWAGVRCPRANCYTCSQGGEKVEDCWRRNIVYESRCITCEERNGGEKKVKVKFGQPIPGRNVYVGETSRSLYERSQEHVRDGAGMMEDSHIAKHWEDKHRGEPMPKFGFRLIRSFQDPLTRQVSESVRIDLHEEVLNSKAVYSRNVLPRLILEKHDWQKEGGNGVGGLEDKGKEKESDRDGWEGGSELNKRKLEEKKRDPRPSKKMRKEKLREDWGEVLQEEEEVLRKWLTEDPVPMVQREQRQGKLKLVSETEVWWGRVATNIFDEAWKEIGEKEERIRLALEEGIRKEGVTRTETEKVGERTETPGKRKISDYFSKTVLGVATGSERRDETHLARDSDMELVRGEIEAELTAERLRKAAELRSKLLEEIASRRTGLLETEERSEEVFTSQLETTSLEEEKLEEVATSQLEVVRQQKCDGAREWEAKKVSTNLVEVEVSRLELTSLEEDMSRTHGWGNVRRRGVRTPGCVHNPKYYEGGESGDKAKGWVRCGADNVQPNTPENRLPSREEYEKRMERKNRSENRIQELLDNSVGMEWLEASASLKEGIIQEELGSGKQKELSSLEEDKKKREERKTRRDSKGNQEWLEDCFGMEWLETSASPEEAHILMEIDREIGYDQQGGWKQEEELGRLVNGKWKGKRKRYEKGRWSDKAREMKMATIPGGWNPRRMEQRQVRKGKRRLKTEMKEEDSRWLEYWVKSLVSKAIAEGWKNIEDKRKRKNRLERAARRRVEWEKDYLGMEWLESNDEAGRKRVERRKKAARSRMEWLETHYKMDWLEAAGANPEKNTSGQTEKETEGLDLGWSGVKALSSLEERSNPENNNIDHDKKQAEAVQATNYLASGVEIQDLRLGLNKVLVNGTKQDAAELRILPPEVPRIPSSNISDKMKIFEGRGGGTEVKRIVKRGRRRKQVGDTLGAGMVQLGIHRFTLKIPPTDRVGRGVFPKGENQAISIEEGGKGGEQLEFLTVLDGMRKKRRLSGGVHTPDKKSKYL